MLSDRLLWVVLGVSTVLLIAFLAAMMFSLQGCSHPVPATAPQVSDVTALACQVVKGGALRAGRDELLVFNLNGDGNPLLLSGVVRAGIFASDRPTLRMTARLDNQPIGVPITIAPTPERNVPSDVQRQIVNCTDPYCVVDYGDLEPMEARLIAQLTPVPFAIAVPPTKGWHKLSVRWEMVDAVDAEACLGPGVLKVELVKPFVTGSRASLEVTSP